MDLTYKNWQYKAISSVTKKCYNTEGILLFHKTGTGKTLTSMGIVKNLGKSFVILCPKQLVYQWKTFYVEYYKKYLPRNYGIIPIENYEKLEKINSEKTVLVVDEAHNLIDIFTKLNSIEQQKFFSILFQFDKRILLTSTPFYKRTSSIGILTYIISKNLKITPIDDLAFEKKFYKINKFHAYFKGWFLPILTDFSQMTKSVLKVLNRIIDFIAIPEIIQKLINDIKKFTKTEKIGSYVYSSIDKFFKSTKNIGNTIASALSSIYTYNIFSIINTPISLVATVILLVTSSLGYIYDKIPTPWEKKFKSFDQKKFLSSGAGKYIDYYDPEKDENSYKYYPKNKKVLKGTSYNEYSSDLFVKYTLAKLENNDYVKLGLIKNPDDAIIFDQKNSDNFINIGRNIGNLMKVFDTEGKEIIKNQEEYVEYDEINTRYKFAKEDYTIKPPQKFFDIMSCIYKNPGRHAVYSNFSGAGKNFSAYLTEQNLDNCYLHNDTDERETKKILTSFFSNKNGVLVLDTDYYQGISLGGVETLHIMEPCLTLSKQKQVEGRNRRIGEYSEDYIVKQIVYFSNFSNYRISKANAKSYLKDNTYVWYSQVITTHDQGITPDAFVLRILENNEEIMKKTEKYFDEHKNYMKDESCKEMLCEITEINDIATQKSCDIQLKDK